MTWPRSRRGCCRANPTITAHALIAAIDNLAALTNVDLDNAGELATKLAAPARSSADTARPCQPELFDTDGDDEREPA